MTPPSWSAPRNPIGDWKIEAGRAKIADLLAGLMAMALPWSTTIFGILTVLWLLALATVINLRQFRDLIKLRPWALSIALFGLAIAGMLWANAPWSARIHVAGTSVKLLALPLLVYQFQQSENGIKVFVAFYVSCIVLLSLSWLNWIDQRTIMFSTKVIGVPVKNYITQGVEFVLCLFGSLALAIALWQKQRSYASLLFFVLAAAFLANLVFIPSSRTSLLSLLVLLPISTYRYIGWRRSMALYGLFVIVGGVAWLTSANLRQRIDSIQDQLVRYERDGIDTSAGLRLGYWTKSLKFISEAPLIGHGTGSIRGLFEREASGKTVPNEEVVANPHNQTLYFGVEWGVIGIVLLYALWISHFLLFTELRWMSWLGLLVVSQNVFDSLFNSHLSDYVEGWIYVIGVGIAAGSISGSKLKERRMCEF